MKSQVLHTVGCNISGEAAGEIWNWTLTGWRFHKASKIRWQFGNLVTGTSQQQITPITFLDEVPTVFVSLSAVRGYSESTEDLDTIGRDQNVRTTSDACFTSRADPSECVGLLRKCAPTPERTHRSASDCFGSVLHLPSGPIGVRRIASEVCSTSRADPSDCVGWRRTASEVPSPPDPTHRIASADIGLLRECTSPAVLGVGPSGVRRLLSECCASVFLKEQFGTIRPIAASRPASKSPSPTQRNLSGVRGLHTDCLASASKRILGTQQSVSAIFRNLPDLGSSSTAAQHKFERQLWRRANRRRGRRRCTWKRSVLKAAGAGWCALGLLWWTSWLSASRIRLESSTAF